MKSYYEQWLEEGIKWMSDYRRRILIMMTVKVMPSVIFLLGVIFGLMQMLSYGTAEDAIGGALGGGIMGAAISLLCILFLLPGLNPKRLSRSIQKAVKSLNMNESERELLGQEMLIAARNPECIVNFDIVKPRSKETPARFILSPHYACLWGSIPLAILVRLSDVAAIHPDEEKEMEVTYGTQSRTLHRFTLYTILFYYKRIFSENSEKEDEADIKMEFVNPKIRDKIFNMLQK